MQKKRSKWREFKDRNAKVRFNLRVVKLLFFPNMIEKSSFTNGKHSLRMLLISARLTFERSLNVSYLLNMGDTAF